jgi:hypothetical protein
MALPREGAEVAEIKGFGRCLGGARCIEVQCASRAVPKRPYQFNGARP